MSFALDLSDRMAGHAAFSDILWRLESSGAARFIAAEIEIVTEPPSREDLHKLLYCAGVFVQTDVLAYRRMAQSIALNSLIVAGGDEGAYQRGRRILTDLGNFPALDRVRSEGAETGASFLDALRRTLSCELNTVRVGDQWIPLTDFQKDTWDELPDARAIAISAPTSAGKSFLVIEHLCRQVERAASFCAVYVAPTRALLSEVSAKIQRRLGEAADVRITTVPTQDPSGPDRQVFVLTQERLQVLLAASAVTFDLVVVDEAQNLSDGSRGMILQDSVEQAVSRSETTRLVLLAPGARGFEAVGASLGAPDLTVARSELSSVLQNRIQLRKAEVGNALELDLLTPDGPRRLGTYRSGRGFDVPDSRLAAAALELGSTGGSLVYATGPTDAERVARQLAHDLKDGGDPALATISDFVRKHIHPEYTLAGMIRKGVAFHYGKMPTLLRETLEGAFRDGHVNFLVCTTTLFEGINLPARNVFIDTPTRGTRKPLAPAALWNFAGRAGRMSADIVGNVFLVDYEDWPDKPLDVFVGYEVQSAFLRTASEVPDRLLGALGGAMPAELPNDDDAQRVRAAAGLLISKAAGGEVRRYVDRTLGSLNEELRTRLTEASIAATERIGLPATLLATNWTVDPFGLRRLYDNMLEKVEEEKTRKLIPVSPLGMGAYKSYSSIFSRIHREVNRGSVNFAGLVSGIALDWMRGVPYPVMLAKAVRRQTRFDAKRIEANRIIREKNPASRVRDPDEIVVDDVVRREFDLIEDQVRFRFVQLGKAYIDILNIILRESGQEGLIGDVYDFPLALELGISSKSGWSFMELGLSRIAAAALQPEFPDSNLTPEAARSWLAGIEDIGTLRLGPVIVDELRRLKLVRPAG
ncbi:DEAD/DEAH box helicase [Methylobacterium sp. J-067]|uniref:DEAD/DEAH box helicase n=1 Tax=Methylobacterium sp. J-067 TaxID=2836648 RepID=UPI001FBB09A0|nr:DEAD/DEAH box helicase [Methylobacterium sp. J-067]MCJ2024053.1 DEAD/DEAH box helicase [Methylobacterium sp. J-067]